MPIKPGTKPNVVDWAEVSWSDLQVVLRTLATHKTNPRVMRSRVVSGKRTIFTADDEIVAKHTIHKRSTQTLVAAKYYREFLQNKNADAK